MSVHPTMWKFHEFCGHCNCNSDFYVKSILEDEEVLKEAGFAILGALNCVDLVISDCLPGFWNSKDSNDQVPEPLAGEISMAAAIRLSRTHFCSSVSRWSKTQLLVVCFGDFQLQL